MNKANLVLTGMVFLALTLGCSTMMKGKEAAEPSVAKFHQQFNDKQFAMVYADSSSQLKEAVAEKDWVAMLETVYGRMGAFKKAEATDWSLNTVTLGTVLKIKYDSEFAQARGTEEFTFLIEGDKASLVGYSVESDALKGK